jgi:hypothetical protein
MSTELNPLAVSIRKCNEITLHPLNPTMHGGGGGITRVIATVAAVAVPFAAPGIAASLGVSGAISAATGLTVSSTVASAITGAAMGGIAAAVGGQSITRGALMGGIGGAVGGYLQGGEPAITTATGEAVAAGGSGLPGVPEIGLSTASPAEAVFGPAATGPALSVPGAGVSIPGALPQSAVTATTTQGLGQSLTDTLRNTGSKILDKVTSPDVLASATLQAAGQLTAAAMVPEAGLPGFSPEEQELVEARRQELEELKVRDLDAYNQQIAISKQYLQQAGLVDPTYFATQSANRALIASARARKQQEDEQAFDPFRSSTPGQDVRTNLATARQRQTAFDKGYLEGIGLQTDYTQAARETMPTSSPTKYYEGLAGLQDTLAYGSRIGDQQRQNIADFSSQFNLQTGKDEEGKKKLDDNIRAGLAMASQDSYLDDEFEKNTQAYIGGLAT